MPPAIEAFVWGLFAVVEFIAGPTIAAFVVSETGLLLLTLAGLNVLSDALVGDLPDVATPSRTFNVMKRNTLEYQRIIYGETICSGLVTYVNAGGERNRELWHDIAIAGHEITSYGDMWVDDVRIPKEYINYAGNAGWVESGDFFGTINPSNGHALWFSLHYGTNSQWVDSGLQDTFTEVNTAHRGRGIAHFLTYCDYWEGSVDVWSKGVPNNFRAEVRGKKVYDPRSDSSQSFGTGPHRVNSWTTWEWSDNPALCWADYMIDSQVGFGEDTNRIDYGYVASAAEYCDGVVWTPVGTDKRYRCNGILSTGDKHEVNIKRILSAMNGNVNFSNGTWKVRPAQYTTPTLQLNEDMMRGDIRIKLDPDDNQRFNTVRGHFIDKDRQWKPSQFPRVTASEYVSRDNDQIIYRDISLDMTKDVYAAQRLAMGVLEQSDLQITAILPTNYKTLPVEIGGTIMLSVDKMGWVDKEFRVTQYQLNETKGIDLVIREDTVGAYTDPGTADYTISSGGGYVVNAIGVPPPSSMWAVPHVDGVYLEITPPPARLYDKVRWYGATSSDWASMVQIGETRATEFQHVTNRPNKFYYYSRAVNYAGELSDKFPNSDYTNIFAQPGILGGRPDWTFDLSSDIEDYYEGISQAWINTSGGEAGGHAVQTSGSVWSGLQSFYTKQRFPISGNYLRLKTRYKINSWFGDDTPKGFIRFGVTGYYPTPISSDWKTKTEISTYTVGGGTSATFFTASLDTSGAWTDLEASFSLKNLIGSGSTLFRYGITLDTSDTITIDNKYNVLFDSLTHFFTAKKLDSYEVKEVAGTISSGKLALNFENGNTIHTQVGATITSITIDNWPDNGVHGELLVTFQRSGSSTAVVNTTAWPSAIKWAGGTQFVLTTNSGGLGRVALSTRDGGTTILADRVDGYS